MTRPTTNDPIFDEPLLERSSVAMLPNYFPDTPGVLFAGGKMLKYAGCVSGARCPYGWEKIVAGVYVRHPRYYEKVGQFDTLRVRQSGDWRTRRWAVERFDSFSRNDSQALVFGLGYVPVWAHSRREAMFLAEFYQSDDALQLVGCCWKKPYLQ
jgi:hypothetical protein